MRRLVQVCAVVAAFVAASLSVTPIAAASPSHRQPPGGRWLRSPDGRIVEPAAHGGVHGLKRLRMTPAATTGTAHWVILRCAYQQMWSGQPPRTQPPTSYFNTMFSSGSPGLANYWHAASYGALAITHTTAGTTTEWRTMPHPNTSYGTDNGFSAHITASFDTLADDCASVWDPDVFFSASTYYAILLDQTINTDGTIGVGGGFPLNMDSVATIGGVLLGPASTDETVWAHEIGHAFGLVHSLSQDPDGSNVYDHPYDIMSSSWGDCYTAGSGWDGDTTDPRNIRTSGYGCIPGQTLAWNKAKNLGWIPAARQYRNLFGSHTINLEELAKPASTTRPLYAEVVVSHDLYYTVEARLKTGISAALQTGYDESFAARKGGSIVTKFVPNDPRAPVGCVVINQVVDKQIVLMGTDTNHDGFWDDAGTCFRPGMTWTDPTGKYSVRVNSMGSSSINVTLTNPPLEPGAYLPLPRTRILNTQTTTGGHKGKLGANQTLSLHVLGVGGIPGNDVQAVVLNLHAPNPDSDAILTAWPAGIARPQVRIMQTTAGQPDDAVVTVAPGSNGSISIWNSAGSTDLDVDVMGVYTESDHALKYQGIDPFVVYPSDGHGGTVGGYPMVIGANKARAFQATNYGNVGAHAGAVALNIRVLPAAANGSLTVYPTGRARPSLIDFTYALNDDVTRYTIVPLSANGRFNVYNASSSQVSVIIEIMGWYDTYAADTFHAVNPAHSTTVHVTSGTPKTATLAGSAGVPATGVSDVLGSVSVVNPSGPGGLTVRRSDQGDELGGYDASWTDEDVNAFASKIGPTGAVKVTTYGADTTARIDVFGWFGAP
jgi:M6 family metalloprotease-like protein